MKTKQSFLAALVGIFAFAMTAVSCKNNEPVVPNPYTGPKPVSAYIIYGFTPDAESMAKLDFFMDYYDQNGEVQTVKLSATPWEQKVEAALPAKFGQRLRIALKEGVTVADDEKVPINYAFKYETCSLREDGTKASDEYKIEDNVISQSHGDKFKKRLEDPVLRAVVCKYDAEGKLSVIKAWE